MTPIVNEVDLIYSGHLTIRFPGDVALSAPVHVHQKASWYLANAETRKMIEHAIRLAAGDLIKRTHEIVKSIQLEGGIGGEVS